MSDFRTGRRTSCQAAGIDNVHVLGLTRTDRIFDLCVARFGTIALYGPLARRLVPELLLCLVAAPRRKLDRRLQSWLS